MKLAVRIRVARASGWETATDPQPAAFLSEAGFVAPA
jgi:hypothetical protein